MQILCKSDYRHRTSNEMSMPFHAGTVYEVEDELGQTLLNLAPNDFTTDIPKEVEESEETNAEPRELTVAELRQIAKDEGIDLAGATRKEDIRAAIVGGLSVQGLRDLAGREGVNLHGATTKAQIQGAFSTGGAQPVPEEPQRSINEDTGATSFYGETGPRTGQGLEVEGGHEAR